MLRIFRRKHAFTLMEIMSVFVIFTLVSGTLYRFFSGTWGNYYKNQTKLTNLRSASLLLEQLKHDLRLATVPTGPPPNPQADSAGNLELQFQITDGYIKKIIKYSYKSSTGLVERSEDNRPTRSLGQAKVSSFTMTIGGTPPSAQFLKVYIKVDADKDEKNRTASSLGSEVPLSAIIFPRFFKNFSSPEEKYWNQARAVR